MILNVPGAQLYYEIQGSGPTLLLVGHPLGCSGFVPLSKKLSENYTVVTHDPRGFGRSVIDDSNQDAEPAVLADDLRRLIQRVAPNTSVDIFSSSGGAVIGMELVTKYAVNVNTLILHEPPLALLVPDKRTVQYLLRKTCLTYFREGIGQAWKSFSDCSGVQFQGSTSLQFSPEMIAMSNRFFQHGLLPIALYKPDLEAVSTVSTEIVVANGLDSVGQFPHRATISLAEELAKKIVDFPGGHTGFITKPEEFAIVLRHALKFK